MSSEPANHKPGLGRFRFKLLAAIMLVVGAITALALYVLQAKSMQDVERELDREFNSALAAMHGAREARLGNLAERCRTLARSVRIRAALEESSARDLYANAEIELRDVLRSAEDGSPQASSRPLRARFFRFLDADGAPISPPRPDGSATPVLAPWEEQLRLPAGATEQQVGFVPTGSGTGDPRLSEIVATPIVAGDTGELLGTIVLGFPPAMLAPGDGSAGMKSGVWVQGRVFLAPLSQEVRGALGDRLAREMARPDHAQGSFRMEEGGSSQLIFYRPLNAGSRYPLAHEVCLFPLEESQARQARLRWQVLGAGSALLLVGFIASNFISQRLAAPVEKLAEVSAENRAQRDRAESALEVSNEELAARNADLQRALTELKATQQHVIQQERLSALGQMASGIAHDFNNALVPILGFCQLLKLKPAMMADRAKLEGYLDVIHTAAQDAANVVSRLHEFYRKRSDQEEFAAVDLRRVVEQAIQLTQPRWKDQAQSRGVTVDVRAEVKHVGPVAGDASALREVLTNLIFNAVDAMPSGGTLTIRIRPAGKSAVLEVSDTGAGMPEEVRRRCLEPFFSTKGSAGTGLGLSMVFGIVQRHGGTLDVTSTLGVGTTFTLTLPLQSKPDRPAPPPTEEPPPQPLHILVVDDEPRVLQLLVMALQADGHTVTTAPQADEALREFQLSTFDLVITDKAMPGMSGDRLAAAIKAISPRTPVILLTGFGQFVEKGDLDHVDVLISKPPDLKQLREAVATVTQKS